jgi:hypothetical protein
VRGRAAGVVVGLAAVAALGAWAVLARGLTAPRRAPPATEPPPAIAHNDADDVPPVPPTVGAGRISVHGVVGSSDGTPVAGAVVELLWPAPPSLWRTETRADGTFAFEPLPATKSAAAALLQVSARGFVQGGSHCPSDTPSDAGVTVLLQPAVRVRGRCVDESGDPVAVQLQSRGRTIGRSGPDDLFDVDGVDPGDEFVVVPRTHAPVAIRLPPGRDVVLGDVTVVSGQSIRGTAVDTAGALRAGVEIRVVGAAGWIRSADSGADGRFELRGLPGGTYDVEGRDAGANGRAATLVGVPAGGPEIRFVVPAGLRVRFLLLRADDRTAVRPTSLKVQVSPSEGNRRGVLRDWTDPQGLSPALVYDVDEAGPHVATLSVGGFEDARIEDIVVTDAAETVVPVLLRAAR